MEAPQVAIRGSDTATGETQQVDLVKAQKQLEVAVTAITKKKRKETDSRGLVWEHFEKILDKKGKLLKANYIYYAKILFANIEKNGISFIRHHILICLKT